MKKFIILALLAFISQIGKAEPQKNIIPEDLQGNWLATDGSNEWKYGIYDSLIICDHDFWRDYTITAKGKKYQVLLKKDGESKILFAEPAKNGKLYIGLKPGKSELLSRTKTFRKKYVIKNDEDFTLPFFRQDTAVFKGYIGKYNLAYGNTGKVYINNIISGDQESVQIEIKPDGTFEAKCPLIQPQYVYLNLPTMRGNVFLTPGDTLLQYIDSTELMSRYMNWAEYNKREHKSLFMGDYARVNADLQATASINYFDYDKTMKEILNMNAESYRSSCLDTLKKEQAALQNYLENNLISKKALTLIQLELPFRAYENILSYDINKRYAYREANHIPESQRDIPLEIEELQPEYLSFIDGNQLNNPKAMLSGSYRSLINRIQYADCVRPSDNVAFTLFADSLEAHKIILTTDEQSLLDKLINCKHYKNIGAIIQHDSITAKALLIDKYGVIFRSIGPGAYEKVRSQNYKKYFGLSDGIAREVMFAQIMSSGLSGRNKPFSDVDKQSINDQIKTPFIVDYLMQLSWVKEEEIAKLALENKTKTGYVINETPNTGGDKVFDAIMAKYKGKVVFVDFWATWCGPCRAGIQKMKPIKEELKDKDVVFVYLTNETSPLDTWNLLIPDIKGEHYRVNEAEWKSLTSRFNITGIPHYTLVDKNGKVAKDGIYFNLQANEFKGLIEEYLR